MREIESAGRLESHSLGVTLRGNLSRFFNGGILYTIGRAYSDTGGASSIPADNFDLSGEWSRAGHDRRHRFRTFGTIRFGKFFNLGMVFSTYSGRPYNLTTGRDDNHDGRALQSMLR